MPKNQFRCNPQIVFTGLQSQASYKLLVVGMNFTCYVYDMSLKIEGSKTVQDPKCKWIRKLTAII